MSSQESTSSREPETENEYRIELFGKDEAAIKMDPNTTLALTTYDGKHAISVNRLQTDGSTQVIVHLDITTGIKPNHPDWIIAEVLHDDKRYILAPVARPEEPEQTHLMVAEYARNPEKYDMVMHHRHWKEMRKRLRVPTKLVEADWMSLWHWMDKHGGWWIHHRAEKLGFHERMDCTMPYIINDATATSVRWFELTTHQAESQCAGFQFQVVNFCDCLPSVLPREDEAKNWLARRGHKFYKNRYNDATFWRIYFEIHYEIENRQCPSIAYCVEEAWKNLWKCKCEIIYPRPVLPPRVEQPAPAMPLGHRIAQICRIM